MRYTVFQFNCLLRACVVAYDGQLVESGPLLVQLAFVGSESVALILEGFTMYLFI